jgi:pyridoxal phosphate enzyme (YggS family)
MTIADRWRAVQARVVGACERAGRPPAEVALIAVSKTQPIEAVTAAAQAGATDFGENYAQELATKLAAVVGAPPVRWHFIGRLQRNKVKLVAGKVALIHAVDTVELAEEIGKRAGGAAQPILLAINLAGERSKGGVTGEDAPTIARQLAAVAGCSLDGLMTMPPPADDAAASQPYFEDLRALRDRLQDQLGRRLPVLSMGMSHDFEIAIACGATHVRVGTAIFGARG